MSVSRKESRRSRRQAIEVAGGSTRAARWRWAVAPVFLIAMAAAAWHYFPRPVGLPLIDHANQSQVEKGRRIYVAECASCHGANLEGQANWRRLLPSGKLPAPPHDASGHTWHHSDQVLFDMTKKGPAALPSGYRTDMPAFAGKLTDEDIAAVLAFIKSTWPDDVLRRQPKARN